MKSRALARDRAEATAARNVIIIQQGVAPLGYEVGGTPVTS